MTIKEIENYADMTRANIRFYEAEGLLKPDRTENGYRDYSKEDLYVLLRVKLLRALGISLQEIKRVHQSEIDLHHLLENHINNLDAKQNELEASREICRRMNEAGISYETMDAQYYYEQLKNLSENMQQILVKDVIQKEKIPWRRYFARLLDYGIYALLVNVFLSLVVHMNLTYTSGGSLLEGIFAICIMWLAEPLLLHKYGTTIGKWILGIYVTDGEDHKLSYRAAVHRTSLVLVYGLAFYVPLAYIWRLWKSYYDYNENQTLAWEEESELILRDKKIYRSMVYIGCYGLMLAFGMAISYLAEVPINRGSLTLAEFCENYNWISDYLYEDDGKDLDGFGRWQEKTNTEITVTMFEPPEFEFIEVDHEVTGVGFTFESVSQDLHLAPSCSEYMVASALAYIGAQKDISLFSKDRYEIVTYIESHLFEDFSYRKAGIEMSCDVEYTGYEKLEDILYLKKDEIPHYRIEFQMRKAENQMSKMEH